MLKTETGHTLEDPGTVRLQYYDVHFWEDKQEFEEQIKGKGLITSVTGETVEILHDPRIKEPRGRNKKENETDLL